MKNRMRWLSVLFYRIRFLINSVVKQVYEYIKLCNSIVLYDITCWDGANRTDITTIHNTYSPKNVLKVAYYRPLI